MISSGGLGLRGSGVRRNCHMNQTSFTPLCTQAQNLQAMTYTIMAPSGLRNAFLGVAASSFGGWCILACPDSKPADFIAVASKQAWWQLNLTVLQKICRLIGVPIQREVKLFQLVFTMVQSVLHCDDSAALDICMKRFLGRVSRHDDVYRTLSSTLLCSGRFLPTGVAGEPCSSVWRGCCPQVGCCGDRVVWHDLLDCVVTAHGLGNTPSLFILTCHCGCSPG